ncbi:MAG: SDR family oxidoreductase [Chitinophagales bacterium]|nr:SDR family oxidoreductase [Chitinophagales bacterium]
MKFYKDKVIVITGAGSGIGRALAKKLSSYGASVAINDKNAETLAETLAMIDSGERKNSQFAADISVPEEVDLFAKHVIAEHGKVDVLINNAGVALGRMKTEEISLEQWDWIMRVNFGGHLLCTNAFLPYLKKQKEGYIANLSSIFGSAVLKERAGYCASKSAINGMTEAMRQEFKNTNVHISLVIPGGIRTNLTNNSEGWKDKNMQNRAAKMQSEDSLTSAEDGADVILNGIRKRKYRILIGKDAKVLDWLSRFTPTYYGRVLNFFVSRAERKQS